MLGRIQKKSYGGDVLKVTVLLIQLARWVNDEIRFTVGFATKYFFPTNSQTKLSIEYVSKTYRLRWRQS